MSLAPSNRARLQASCALAGALALRWRVGGSVSVVVLILAGLLAGLAWFSPSKYAPVQRLFDRITDLLLAGLTWLVLGAVYFGFFTPLRLGRMLLRRDSLQLRRDPAAVSFLRPIAPRPSSHFERQF